MKPKQAVVLLLKSTKTGEKFLSDQRYRVVLSATISFVLNLLYALYHCVLGVINLSFWFIAMCAFYGILATTRFSAVLCEYKRDASSSDHRENFVMKFSGILLSALSAVFAIVLYISLSQNIATRYDEITMITIATYTFYNITISAVRATKQRRNPSPLLKTIRSIRYAEVAASVLTLQRSMLVSFGSMGDGKIRQMNALTGAAVCLFVLTLGISMIVKSTRKDNGSWQNQSL